MKKKKGAVTLEVRKTGGGEADVPELSIAEEKLLATMGGKIVVEGDASIPEYGFSSGPVSNK